MTFFENSLFPFTVIEWNKTDKNIRKSESLNIFKNSILKHIRPPQNIVCNCHSPKTIKLLARLRVGLSHLHKHKFKHSFQFSLPSSMSRLFTRKDDSLEYSHLYCSLLYCKENLHNINNTSILDATIKYLIETKRFGTQLFLCSPDLMALILILHLKFIFFLFCFYYF